MINDLGNGSASEIYQDRMINRRIISFSHSGTKVVKNANASSSKIRKENQLSDHLLLIPENTRFRKKKNKLELKFNTMYYNL